MIGYLEAASAMHTRGMYIDEKDYIFALSIVLGDEPQNAFALAYDTEELKRVIGSEEEEVYLSSKKKDANVCIEQKTISHLIDLIGDSYRADIQKKALDLKDYKFSADETIQILNNLLKSRVDDIDSASVKDVVQVIKTLTDQGALEVGDGGFSRHFVQIFPKYNALCTKCGREFDAMRGLSAKCPHCEQVYQWSEEEQRFYPEVGHL